MRSLSSLCQGSDPPQKHAGVGSPSPAVENNSSHYQTTSDADPEQLALSTVNPTSRHTDPDTSCVNVTQTCTSAHVHTPKPPEGMKEILLCTCFCFIMVDLSQRLRSLLVV